MVTHTPSLSAQRLTVNQRFVSPAGRALAPRTQTAWPPMERLCSGTTAAPGTAISAGSRKLGRKQLKLFLLYAFYIKATVSKELVIYTIICEYITLTSKNLTGSSLFRSETLGSHSRTR